MSAEQHNSARNNHAATAVAVVAAVPALAPGASPAHPQPVPVAHAQPLSPPLVQDLPDELIQGGWSKCWSRRENRPYFYNRFTKQSLWELPALGQHDVISDPLGLNAAPVGGAPGAPAAGATGASVEDAALRKRRLSEEIGAGVAGAASAVSKRTKSEDVMPVTPVTPVPKGWKAEAGFASPTQKPKPPTLPFPYALPACPLLPTPKHCICSSVLLLKFDVFILRSLKFVFRASWSGQVARWKSDWFAIGRLQVRILTCLGLIQPTDPAMSVFILTTILFLRELFFSPAYFSV